MKKVSIAVAPVLTRTALESNSKDKEEYRKYLKSTKWRIKRKRILEKQCYCQKCLSTKLLQVHHLHYRNIFNEKDGDLVVLCEFCHKKLHKDFETRIHKSQTLEVFTGIQINRWRIDTSKMTSDWKTLREEKIQREKEQERERIDKLLLSKKTMNKMAQDRIRQRIKNKKKKHKKEQVTKWSNPKYNADKKKFEYIPYTPPISKRELAKKKHKLAGKHLFENGKYIGFPS